MPAIEDRKTDLFRTYYNMYVMDLCYSNEVLMFLIGNIYFHS